jgi:hypothetical protein
VSTESSALPVELISFSGKYKKENVYLDWQTVNEVNNYGWELERCGLIINQQTNYNWQSIGFVSGSGNSNSPKSYSFVDNGVEGANSYLYRLKQIDTDGSFEYSPEVKIVVEKIEFVLNQNYPNPCLCRQAGV